MATTHFRRLDPEAVASPTSLTKRLGLEAAARDAQRSHLRRWLLATDAAALALAQQVGSLLAGRPLLSWANALATLAAAALGVLVAACSGLYLSRVSTVRSIELARLTRVAAAAALVAILASAADGAASDVAAARLVMWFSVVFAVSFLVLMAGRSVFDAVIRERRRQGRYCRHVLVVGDDPEREQVVSLILDHPELGYRIDGLLGSRPLDQRDGPAWLGPETDLLDTLEQTCARGVILTSSQLPSSRRDAAVRHLIDQGIHVQLSGGIVGVDPRRLRTTAIAYQALFYVEPVKLRGPQVVIKRAMDILIGSVLLVVALPILAVAAVAIWVEDRGPIFYRQVRIGRQGQPFTLLKLRSMNGNADQGIQDLQNIRKGPLFKSLRDPRVTRVGRVLRLTSIDELPQLLQVVQGRMSLVGPRPALPEEVAAFDEELKLRSSVPPGLTGLWQIEARDNPSFESYRRFDLFYVENWRMSLDVVILLLTLQAVVSRTLISLTRVGQRREVARMAAISEHDPVD